MSGAVKRQWMSAGLSLQPPPPPPIRQDRTCRVVAGRAGDAAAGMRARAAVVEARDGAAVVGMAEHWPRPEELVKRQRAVEDIAADEPERLLEIERAQGLASDHARLEARRIALDRVDHQVGNLVAMRVPGAALRQRRRDVLAEQARDMGALGGKRVVEGRGDQHLDDRLAAPALLARVRE